MRILVIGAGASGLVTAKTLKSAGHDVSIVEAADIIGGVYENKRYKDAQMVSSKHLTCFSDFRRPDVAMHMSLLDYASYLREYAKEFELLPLMRLQVEVLELHRIEGGGYAVSLRSTGTKHETFEERYEAVAICSGLHNIPRIPVFPGQDNFEGQILHSATYKDPEIFKGRRVLIVGTGETAFDIGYAAAKHGAASVTMSTRHGFISVPASFGEKNPPLDCIIMNFATHAWESRWAQRVGMHWWVTTKFTRLGFFFMTGCSYGFNQWVGRRHNLTWDEGRKHIVNKSSKCMPLLSRKAKKEAPQWKQWVYSWWDTGVSDIDTDIDLVEGRITKFGKNTIHYETTSSERIVEADIVVLATGYRQRFPFLRKAMSQEEATCDDPLPEQHFIVDPAEPRLAYIGFIRPNVGAIPPMAEMQAMWWSRKLINGLVPETDANGWDRACYKLKECHLPYGVDYGYYMFALARDIGCMPSLWYWLRRNWRICVTCGFGQAHIPIFRLQGPFRMAKAEETCAGELFSVILKRPVSMNLIFLVEALCFSVINGAAELVTWCSQANHWALLGGGAGLLTLWQTRWSALQLGWRS